MDRTFCFSRINACEDCGVSIEELTPGLSPSNNSLWACTGCTGLGSQLKVDPQRIIPNAKLSI